MADILFLDDFRNPDSKSSTSSPMCSGSCDPVSEPVSISQHSSKQNPSIMETPKSPDNQSIPKSSSNNSCEAASDDDDDDLLDRDSSSESHGSQIDLGVLRANTRMLRSGLLQPAAEDVTLDLADEHAAEPIKHMEDILRVSRYLKSHGRWRDNMLFIIGINFGLRVSDLLSLRFTNIINNDMVFRDKFAILEKKTRNTRRVSKNRYITINCAVMDAVTLYLENTPGVKLDDFLFRSESNRGGNQNKPLTRMSVDRILKGIAKDLGLGNRMSSHSLRKTFGYHQMVMSGNDPRKLLLLQKMFGHSTAAQTLDYIGITEEEIDEAYRKLNLGSETANYLIDGVLMEECIRPA